MSQMKIWILPTSLSRIYSFLSFSSLIYWNWLSLKYIVSWFSDNIDAQWNWSPKHLELFLLLIFFTYFIFRTIFFKLFLLPFDAKSIISPSPSLHTHLTLLTLLQIHALLFHSFSYIYIAIYLYIPQAAYVACMYVFRVLVLKNILVCSFLSKTVS